MKATPMAKLTSIFEYLQDLDYIPTEEINRWLKHQVVPNSLLNFLGNRVLYPESISVTKEDLEIDRALLREILKRKPELIYDQNSRKIFLDPSLVNRVPPKNDFVVALVEALDLTGITQIIFRNGKEETLLGSVVVLASASDQIEISLNNLEQQLQIGTITVIPMLGQNIILKIGKDQEVKVSGGEIGIIFDTRHKM
jgi:hypothetical protein